MDCVEYGVWNLLDGRVVLGGLIFIHFLPPCFPFLSRLGRGQPGYLSHS